MQREAAAEELRLHDLGLRLVKVVGAPSSALARVHQFVDLSALQDDDFLLKDIGDMHHSLLDVAFE